MKPTLKPALKPTLRLAASLLALTALAVSAPGCGALKFWDFHAAPNLPRIDNPFPALQQIAVTPVAAPSEVYSGEDWTQVLERAVLIVDGITQVRRVAALAPDDDELPELPAGSQGLLEIHVRAFDPFYPPRAHVEVNFYVPQSLRGGNGDGLIELERRGSPLGKRGGEPRKPWLRFERVYDASDARVARRLRRYARSQSDWDRGMKPEERVTRVAERYLEFVFYETLRECFMGLEAKEEESDGFLRKLLARAAE